MKPRLNKLHVIAVLIALLGSLPPLFGQNSADQTSQTGTAAPSGGVDPNTYNYQADLFTGRFTYGIPITVAPGRQGAQPTITLGYNSAAGNGWCGVGWSLDMGYIQRDTRHGVPIAWAQAYGTTNYLDYNLPLAQYDDSKGFISSFGGVSSTLVEVGPTNQNPIIYRQQVDTSFLTYEYFTNDYWEVIDKSGNSFFFGESTNSQMENTKTNWPQGVGSSTWRWALDRVVDVNGNETFLNYTPDRGALYLTNILYNANTNAPAIAASDEVDFLLTNRPDTNFTFISGFRVTSDKLLSEIDVKAGGQNVRKYVLGYTQSPSTLRSLLNSFTEYGSDYTTALPPLTFQYQVESFAFGPETNWPTYSQGYPYDRDLIAVTAHDSLVSSYLETVQLIDIDGDGLPDRVMAPGGNPGVYTNYYAERNTGGTFAFTSVAGATADYPLGPLLSQGQTGLNWNSPGCADTSGSTYVELIDINGDGYPDRVMREAQSPYTNFWAQLNDGLISPSNTFQADTLWTNVDDYEYPGDANGEWLSDQYTSSSGSGDWNNVNLIDMNGGGLPDRVSCDSGADLQEFKVQVNTGGGFTRDELWQGLSSAQTNLAWDTISAQDSGENYYVTLMDINGDGLPDRVMRQLSPPYTNFVVQFNNGAGFEPPEIWGPIDTQGNSNNAAWAGPIGSDDEFSQFKATMTSLIDVNGDGLPDRVMRSVNFTNWVVQINTGTGFAPSVIWSGIGGLPSNYNPYYEISTESLPSGDPSGVWTVVDCLDMNGDGLPDRVTENTVDATNFWIQDAEGPFPDLLNVVSNGLGGSVQISYIASTTLNNRSKDWTNDPWAEGAKSLLPFNVWVVSQVVTSDGMGNNSTNSYAFKGGYYNWQEKEFRGFSQCTQTDPLGTKTITYFHQSGGRDNSALGEYMDQGSESKKGLPFRIDLIGNDNTTNKITLNKVEEIEMGSNGWYFPYIAQTIEMNYEGQPAYRATAEQFTYDTNTESLVEEANLGEVTNIVFDGQTFASVGDDAVYKWMTYTNFGKPSDVKMTADAAGTQRLKESEMTYDSRGNLTENQEWLNTLGNFVTLWSTTFDQFGNATQSVNSAGVTTYTEYDGASETFPTLQVTGTFTNQFDYDVRSGSEIQTIDPKGLVTSNTYDAFYRNTETFISTNAFGTPWLWRTKTSYQFGGINAGISENYNCQQVNDAVDPINGFVSYTYLDGIDRPIQTRAESEISGQYRVENTEYNPDGNPLFQTSPYFSSGTAFTSINGTYLGTLTGYDSVGRVYQVTPAVDGQFAAGSLTNTAATGGDSGSPMASVTTAFFDNGNPWARVVTDANGKVTKTYYDDRKQTIAILQLASGGNSQTTYSYDLLGDVTNIVDNQGNAISMCYDSLRRKISLNDPDSGSWTYAYDSADRLTNQLDGRGNRIAFSYGDEIGRLTSKQIYNTNGSLAGVISYTYDTSDDPSFPVFKGQLYKITDLQGWEKFGYDARGRILKTGRHLNINAMDYVTQATYDDDDRVQTLTYPNNAATLEYIYNAGGSIAAVQSTAGTGSDVDFYTPQGYNALNQLEGYTNGNGVVTTYSYYPNSARLENLTTSFGSTNYQNLTYTYDAAANIEGVQDGVNSGAGSGTISGITYDDLYRVTSVNSAARGIKRYSYNSIGDLITNQDFGTNAYEYGARPDAVTYANGTAYAYDACGNMVTRGNQTLTYDAQNQLIQVAAATDTVRFGYNDRGERLWRCGTNGYAIWIGGIYEINNGKILCHVVADGKLIATFEPQCEAGWARIFGQRNWYVASTTAGTVLSWPFKQGRSHMTLFAGMWAAILCLCAGASRGVRVRRYSFKTVSRASLTWRQAATIVTISAFLWNSVGRAEAPMYEPIFYYYHSDNISSSNVLTDRYGNLIQLYQYSTFGTTSYQDNTSAFPVSNRFTSQICDDETGLYYYNARYYDAQLGRFIQPDTEIQSLDDPQTLNRYSYCGNNPLTYTDPSGKIFGIDDAIIAIIVWAVIDVAEAAAVGAALGAISSAISGQNIARGALMGAEAGALNEVLGGVLGGVVYAEINGQNVGDAALMGIANTAISLGTTGIDNVAISSAAQDFKVQNFGQFAEYTAIGTASAAAKGATDAAIQGQNIGAGTLSSVETSLATSAIQLTRALGEHYGAEFADAHQLATWVDSLNNNKGLDILGLTIHIPDPPKVFDFGITIPSFRNALIGITPFYSLYHAAKMENTDDIGAGAIEKQIFWNGFIDKVWNSGAIYEGSSTISGAQSDLAKMISAQVFGASTTTSKTKPTETSQQ